jgi:hypothetical protein
MLAAAAMPVTAAARAAAPMEVRLSAATASINGNLRLKGSGEQATIHFWNRKEDRIVWTTDIPSPGTYRLRLRYALAPVMRGGAMAVTAGNDRLVANAVPSRDWNDFVTRSLGSARFGKAGRVMVSLRAAQLPAGDGAALPDVAWLSLERIGARAPHRRPG